MSDHMTGSYHSISTVYIQTSLYSITCHLKPFSRVIKATYASLPMVQHLQRSFKACCHVLLSTTLMNVKQSRKICLLQCRRIRIILHQIQNVKSIVLKTDRWQSRSYSTLCMVHSAISISDTLISL